MNELPPKNLPLDFPLQLALPHLAKDALARPCNLSQVALWVVTIVPLDKGNKYRLCNALNQR